MEEFLSTPSARRATYELRRENQQYKRFLSTPSARRATRQDSRQKLGHTISIHALREEGDPSNLIPQILQVHFYPRPPRGGRPSKSEAPSSCQTFLSTPSARRATLYCISATPRPSYFYPRPPRGGRPSKSEAPSSCQTFLSTPSARRATLYCISATPRPSYFYPRPPRGGRHEPRKIHGR